MLRVIKLLSDGEFRSGEELGNHLNLSRSAVWKLIKQLQHLGIEVETRSGKGYSISNGIQLLNAQIIKNKIETAQLERLASIDVLQTVTSTMDYFDHPELNQEQNILSSFHQINSQQSKTSPLPEAAELALKNRVCFAERQTKGRGRLGREWISPFAKNIYLSMLWYFPKDLSELSGLSLAIATAVIKTLKRLNLNVDEEFGLKWPNDVLYKNQKLAGILIELSGENYHISRAVIGVGLNVFMSNSSNSSHQKDDKIGQPWANVQSIASTPIDRNHLAGDLLNELIKTTMLFEAQGLAPFLDYWRSQDLSFSKPVSILCQGREIQGISRGINVQGNFLLETESQEIKSFSNGDVSLRITEA